MSIYALARIEIIYLDIYLTKGRHNQYIEANYIKNLSKQQKECCNVSQVFHRLLQPNHNNSKYVINFRIFVSLVFGVRWLGTLACYKKGNLKIDIAQKGRVGSLLNINENQYYPSTDFTQKKSPNLAEQESAQSTY